jgi:beta-glucanase (GH16 family)
VGYTTIQEVPVPPCLIGHNYKLKLHENFYNIDVDMKSFSPEFHTWVNGIWFNEPNPTADIRAANGIGTLTWHKEQSPSADTTIRTMQDFRYGYFEARFRFDAIEGSWPAFWLLSSETMNDRTLNGGELDVMEWMSNTPMQCCANVHKWAPDGIEMPVPEPKTAVFYAPEGFNFSDYHTYAIHWTPGTMDCYIDGIWYGSTRIDHQIEMCHYYLMLGQQAGLEWRQDPETLARITASQIQMQISWVRVWQAS